VQAHAAIPSARPYRSLRAAQTLTGRAVSVVGASAGECVHCSMRPVGKPPPWWRPTAGHEHGDLLGAPIREILQVRVAHLFASCCSCRRVHKLHRSTKSCTCALRTCLRAAAAVDVYT
jgi:hypothetical protein